MNPGSPWWERYFDAAYADACLEAIEPAHTHATVEFLARTLQLGPGARLLDQCCGVGRLSVPLAERGLAVTGVDLNPDYITRARRAAVAAGVEADLRQGDSAEPLEPTHEAFDVAINWFTSFGYADESHDLALFARAFEALAPGGRYALDYFNPVPILAGQLRGGVAARLERGIGRVVGRLSRGVGRYPHERAGAAIEASDATIDFADGVLVTRWEIAGERRETRLRLYLPARIIGLLRHVGFESFTLYGGVDGSPFEADSRRCIVVAQRP